MRKLIIKSLTLMLGVGITTDVMAETVTTIEEESFIGSKGYYLLIGGIGLLAVIVLVLSKMRRR